MVAQSVKNRHLVWTPRTQLSYMVKVPGIDRLSVNAQVRKIGYLGEQRPCVKQEKPTPKVAL